MTRGEASGPRPRSRRERRALVDEIARRLCGELCRIVSRGELDSVDHVTAAADALWRGVEVWADAEGLDLYRQLPELLDGGDSGA